MIIFNGFLLDDVLNANLFHSYSCLHLIYMFSVYVFKMNDKYDAVQNVVNIKFAEKKIVA